MKTFALGVAALAALVAAPAAAADLPVKARPMVPKVFDWTGCYVGVHVGGGWQASSYVTQVVASGAGVLGGGQAGCNYQIRQFVVGVEAEVWGSTLYDRRSFSNANTTQDTQSRNIWDVGVSVRAGWAIDNALIYGKLGVVWSEFDYSRNDAFPGFSFSERGNKTTPGLLIGLGFEYALAPNWSAKFEYNYINYGSLLVDFTSVACNPGCVTETFSETMKEAKQIAKVGLNYRFGEGGPMSAMAAAMPLKGPAVPRAFDWTGCYVGVHAGGGMQTSNYVDSLSGFGGLGALGGVQAGCNYQWKRFVIGLEGEFWGSSIQDEDLFREVDFDRREVSRNRWDGAISLRAGVAFDRALVYGKVGGVWGRFDYEDVRVQPTETTTETASATFAGVLLGVGFEYALTDNWTAKFEYNYIDYGNKLVNFTVVECDPLCTTTGFSTTIKETKQLAKVGLNYKFAGTGNPAVMSPIAVGMPTKGPAPLPRMFDWSGCYIGVHAGGGWQASSALSVAQSGVGALGGGQAGCNYQWRRFVIGLEGEVWASSLYDRDEAVFPNSFTSDFQSRNRWDAAVSVRSGIAIEDAFIYGKLGVAWGRFDYSIDSASPPFVATTARGSATFAGLLLGVGFEYALTGNWTTKFEYNYIDFGSSEVDIAFFQCIGATCTTFSERQTSKEIKQIAKVGLNYKFGNPAASSAMAAYASAAPAAVNWTGCYIGAHAGGGWQSSSFTTFAGPFGDIGPLGGGQAGCNYQWQQFVVGLEGEFWGSGVQDRSSFASGTFSGEATSRNRWDAAISARVGYAFERAFLYGKLGGVWGRFDYDDLSLNSGNTDRETGSATFAGVLIGLGFEYALAGNWTAKFEYNYIDFGEVLVGFTDTECVSGTCTTDFFSRTIKERKQLAKLGLNYRFGAR